MIYELYANPNKRPYFIPHDLRYFQDHFVCRKMESSWNPPPAKLMGKSYRPADFISWMLRAPLVSEKAAEFIKVLSRDEVEFLYFCSFNNSNYYAMNVLTLDGRAPIFKKASDSIIFVSDGFGEIAKENQLTGLSLADPDADNGRKIVRGMDVNIFPGLAR